MMIELFKKGYSDNLVLNGFNTKQAHPGFWSQLAQWSKTKNFWDEITHIKRVKRIYHKFFPDYLSLDFYAEENWNKKKIRRKI